MGSGHLRGRRAECGTLAFKDVTPDGKLVVGDVFLDTTLKNIAANNGRIAVSVYDAQNLEGYQVKGTAQYVTEGEVVKTFKAMVERMFSGALTAKEMCIRDSRRAARKARAHGRRLRRHESGEHRRGHRAQAVV